MKNVEYKNMASGVSKNGADYLEVKIGTLEVGDTVVKTVPPSKRELQRRGRSTPKTTIETYVVKDFGGEFYSGLLECDAVRAYCEKTVQYVETV